MHESIHAAGEHLFSGDLYMQAVYTRAVSGLANLPSHVVADGIQLLEKVSPPQWTLEWYLPKWLGEAYGLESGATAGLVLANVYGLAYICLQDMMADDGFDGDRKVSMVCLGAALHHLWIRQYVHLFAAQSSFWTCFDQYMEQWLHATAWSNRLPEQDSPPPVQQNLRRLAHRAAPLKICCAAACVGSGREHLVAPWDEAMDLLHIAAVLLDHVYDWRDDLAAGRYNAFVHFASNAAQTHANMALNRQRVYQAFLHEEVARSYFALATEQMHKALAIAQETACQALVEYLRWYTDKLVACGDELATSARHLLHSAVFLLFPSK